MSKEVSPIERAIGLKELNRSIMIGAYTYHYRPLREREIKKFS
jgi:hypothetical protein